MTEISTNAADSRDRRQTARQHQRDHLSILGPEGSPLSEADQLTLVLQQSTQSNNPDVPDDVADNAISDGALDSGSDAAAPPTGRKPETELPDEDSDSDRSLSTMVAEANAASESDYDEPLAIAQALKVDL